MSKLKELKKEELELLSRLKENKVQQQKIHQDIFIEKYGYKVGELVDFEERGKYLWGKISGISFEFGIENPKYKALIAKKNGQLGMQERVIFNTKTIKRKP